MKYETHPETTPSGDIKHVERAVSTDALPAKPYPCAMCDGEGTTIADNGHRVDCIACGGSGRTTADYTEARELVDRRKAYALTHDPRYSDIVVLMAAKELLEERGQDTENLQSAIWSIKANTAIDDLRPCPECNDGSGIKRQDACTTCNGSGFEVLR